MRIPLEGDFINPYGDLYLHAYMGNFYLRNKQPQKVRFHYQSIIDLNNFSVNWYTKEAQKWLNSQK